MNQPADGYVVGATVRQYHHETMFDDAIIKCVHPNGALDVEIDGKLYGWSTSVCKVIRSNQKGVISEMHNRRETYQHDKPWRYCNA